MKVAVVGYGFVGKAVVHGFTSDKVQLTIIDPKIGSKVEDLSSDQDVVFVCVPTPMSDDGSIDSSIVENVISEISQLVDCPIVLKSTVTPDIIAQLELIDNFVYNPEFLTERNFKNDFENPTHLVLGGKREICEKVEQIYNEYSICGVCPVLYCTAQEASLIKYGINSFLATKVAWFNEYYDLAQSLGVDYDKVISGMSLDPRIGVSHMQVPGYDGQRGFSGSCFPKDTTAIYKMSEEYSVMSILKQAIISNQEIKGNKGASEREKEQNIRYDIAL